MQDKSYLALGLGVGMVDTDMILWIADGDKTAVYDLWSEGYTRPLIDAVDNTVNTI